MTSLIEKEIYEENFFVHLTYETDDCQLYTIKYDNMARHDFEELYGMISDRLVYMKVVGMDEKPKEIGLDETFWIVDIISINKDGKQRSTKCECRNLTDLSSLVLNYRSSRGYVVMKYDIIRGEALI